METQITRQTVDGLVEMAKAYDGPPADQLSMLQGLGVPTETLVRVSLALHHDTGAALLAVPAPLEQVLAALPDHAGERALLGFTLREILEHPEVAESPDHSSWRDLPGTLRSLFAQGHTLLYQVLYTGTVLFYPADSDQWRRCHEVMRRLPCPGAASPHMAPVTPTISSTYDASPFDQERHPFFYFCKNPLP